MNRSSFARLISLALVVLGALALPVSATPIITTFAGYLIPNGTATNIGVGASGVAVDSSGNVYFADSSNHTIRKLDPTTGLLTVVAGVGTSGFSGDGGLATSAKLNSPKGVAVDSSGNIYIADTSNHRIRKIDTSGNISTIAGTGTGTFGGDNAAATAARVNSPQGVAVDTAGNVYIADTSNNRVRKIDTSGTISTVAGNGTGGYLADNVSATSTRINAPRGVAVDSLGNIYIADTSNNRIRKVASGTITTFAGTGTASFSGDGGAATSATIRAPQALTLDSAGNLYIADTTNHRIRKVNTSGTITTIGGSGSAGYSGDGGAATSAKVSSPAGIAVDSSGNVYVGDTGNLRLRKIDTSGNISTAAGTGSATYGGDGGLATNAQFTNPQQIVFDGAGNIYVSDSGTHRVRKIDTSGVVTTIAGTGAAGYSGDSGPATSAQLNTPLGIALDSSGNLYIADGNNNRIRKVDTGGTITTVAGDGTGTYGGDNGPATSAQIFGPFGVAVYGTDLYITDTGNNRVRKVNASGTITTIAGTGAANFSGDNGLATSATFNTPLGIAINSAGDLFITDYSNGAVRKITAATGIITTVAGNGANGYGGDGGAATSAQLNSPRAVAVDSAGNIYITDTTNSRIRKVDTGGTITTIVGDGNAAFSGDGGLPSAAQVSTPQAITVTSSGNIYIGDTGNRRFRVISEAPPAITSASTASATYGSVFGGFTLSASNFPTSFSASGLPSGLSLNTSTGVISGTPTQAGTFPVSVSATNVSGAGSASTLTITVAKVALTATGVTAANKTYDRTTSASLNTASAALNGLVLGDSLTIDASGASAAFADANVGSGKAVTVSGLALSGSAASNYTLTQPTGVTATISAKGLTISGVTASNKTYDGTTAATLVSSSASLIGVALGDTVSINASGASGVFADASVGATKTVTATGFALSGADASNYSLTQPSGITASITAKALTVTGLSASNKAWDGTTSATITGTASLSGVVAGDVGNVSLSGSAVGTFSNANVGTGKSVSISGLTLSGSAAGNYTLTLPTTTANITAATAIVTLSNLSANYDGSAHGAAVSTAPSGLTVDVTYAGASTLPTNAGNYAVVATVNDAHYSGSASGTLVINPISQTITFGSRALTVGTPVTLNATASSGLPVSYSLISGNATLVGSSLTANDAGAIVVRASQAGNGNYLAATPVDVTFNSAKLSQTITFGALADKNAADPAFTLSASASSGLPVSFALVSGPAALSGSTVTLTGSPGTVTITASQAGNASYDAAPDVTRSFAVGAAGPQIFFGTTASGDNFAASVSRDGTQGSIIGYLAGTKEAFVCNFVPNSDGTFEAVAVVYTGTTSVASDVLDSSSSVPSVHFSIQNPTTAADASTRTFRGQVRNGALAGTILELNLVFSAAIQPPTGSTASIAGYYIAPAVETSSGVTYSIVGTQNTIYVLTVSQGTVAADKGTISASGAFSITTQQGVTVAGSVDPVATTVKGTITFPNKTTQTFTGVNTSTVHTDRLVNLSSRGAAGSGSSTFIAGFIIAGPNNKTVLLRAVGPALAPFGISNFLSNPGLRLYDGSGKLLLSNDGWGNSATLQSAFTRMGLFPFAANSADSAALVTLPPGGYTMHVVSSNGSGAAGVALAEVYDASSNPQTDDQKLVNISTRGNVGTGENVLIGGFVVAGNAAKRVIIRGVGPSLAKYGVSGVLADPILRVYDSKGQMIAMNDNWGTPVTVGTQTPASAADVLAAQTGSGAFAFTTGSKDATVVLTLAPGAYTAVVSGASDTTGVALVEIYEIAQ